METEDRQHAYVALSRHRNQVDLHWSREAFKDEHELRRVGRGCRRPWGPAIRPGPAALLGVHIECAVYTRFEAPTPDAVREIEKTTDHDVVAFVQALGKPFDWALRRLLV